MSGAKSPASAAALVALGRRQGKPLMSRYLLLDTLDAPTGPRWSPLRPEYLRAFDFHRWLIMVSKATGDAPLLALHRALAHGSSRLPAVRLRA